MASESGGCGKAAGHHAGWGAEVGDFRPAPCEKKRSHKMQHFAESMASSVEPKQTFQTGTQEVGGQIGKKK